MALGVGAFGRGFVGLGQHAAAFGAAHVDGFVPGDEIALGPVFAAVENLALAAFLLEDAPAALGAFHARVVNDGPGVAAGGIVGAADESTIASFLDDQIAATFGAFLADLLRLDVLAHHIRAGGFHRLLERPVELLQHLHPVFFAAGDAIQLFRGDAGFYMRAQEIQHLCGKPAGDTHFLYLFRGFNNYAHCVCCLVNLGER